MKRWILSGGAVLILALAVFVNLPRHSSSAAQSCDDWANDTADRVEVARQLLYPAEREGQSTGSVQGDAQALFDIAQDQANSNPPDEAFNLNGDLVEAFSAGSNSLLGGPSSDAQIAFAKSIVYNADLRISYLLDTCG